MQQTTNHKFNNPQLTDKISDSIEGYGTNFEKLDTLIDESANSLSMFLKPNILYTRGKKVWNLLPVIGSYVGWVNVRQGKFANSWQQNTVYNVGDMVAPDVNNGHIYTCTAGGTSGLNDPIFLLSVGSTFADQESAPSWISNNVYEINDIVIAKNGSKFYYYRCIKEGTSNLTEPVWVNTEGTLIDDGSAQWQVYKMPQWKESDISCDFREFGKIQ